MIARWLGVNIFTILLILLWSWYQGYDSNKILLGKVLAQAAFILFLINLNMYFIFLLIRKSKIRKVKITLAKISKRMMKYHVAIAATASLLIIAHAVIMITALFEDLWKAKTASGLITWIVLAVLLFSGLLRRRKSTGMRRKFHYIMAFLFFGFVFFHVFI
ncbi:hypothetical protein J7I93_08600 [Bacillus sp. ISL-47]|uniref:hypothetical protein n=1 Tax=Bacillus sp. ISL-47 TaxID=2819130 RepID=UPI001BE825AD|nr:hypothetical protein [Bacillus sp. ISL-47]MBT2688239.1 hypothetical protein [Bacillus sp. ISL-47]MBT2710032.1 hypothetical protein [Pseudomonas sp. ISL-84]